MSQQNRPQRANTIHASRRLRYRPNGHSVKTLKGVFGQVAIEVPREHQDSFEPQIVKKRQTRLKGFDEKILALYARGMTVRDMQVQLQEMYGVEVSHTLKGILSR